jgi:UDP-GlcNAc3NAcA epimerase
MPPSNTACLRNPAAALWLKTWRPGEFALATVHRAENTDDADRLREIVGALDEIARSRLPVVWPIHPRTRKRLHELEISVTAVTLIEPVSYLDMLLLEGRARLFSPIPGVFRRKLIF